jgi:iron complex transport system ATP-binding protein
VLSAGRVYGLFGPNGCGKSTLLKCLNRHLAVSFGAIFLHGRPILAMSRKEIARKIAVVSQDPPDITGFSVIDGVLMGRYPHWDLWRGENAEDREIARRCLRELGLDRKAEVPLASLSGGERQRASLARAMAQEPDLYLLDEPATHLDIAHQLEFYRLVRALAAAGKTVLMACHDLLLTPLYLDQFFLMDRGQIVSAGSRDEVFTPDNIKRVFGLKDRIRWQGRACTFAPAEA